MRDRNREYEHDDVDERELVEQQHDSREDQQANEESAEHRALHERWSALGTPGDEAGGHQEGHGPHHERDRRADRALATRGESPPEGDPGGATPRDPRGG